MVKTLTLGVELLSINRMYAYTHILFIYTYIIIYKGDSENVYF